VNHRSPSSSFVSGIRQRDRVEIARIVLQASGVTDVILL
jgi:hypothetical protein